MKTVLAAVMAMAFGLGLRTNWELKKEEDGIKVYTSGAATSTFKQFKALSFVNATPAAIAKMVVDVEHNHQWAESVKPGKIIKRDSENEFVFSQVIEMPFPFTDRIMIQRCTTKVLGNGKIRVDLFEDLDALDYDGDLVVVPVSRGYWILNPSNGGTNLEYSFLVDPGGNIPAWLVNAFIVDTPFNSLKNLRELVSKSH